jgi:hypothetical protein
LETPVPPTPSPRFPRDLKSLFQLGFQDAKALLREYGLSSGVSSPTTPNPRGLPDVSTSGSSDANGNTNDDEGHVKDMNKFMAHIGVCYVLLDAKFRSVTYLNFLLFFYQIKRFLS